MNAWNPLPHSPGAQISMAPGIVPLVWSIHEKGRSGFENRSFFQIWPSDWFFSSPHLGFSEIHRGNIFPIVSEFCFPHATDTTNLLGWSYSITQLQHPIIYMVAWYPFHTEMHMRTYTAHWSSAFGEFASYGASWATCFFKIFNWQVGLKQWFLLPAELILACCLPTRVSAIGWSYYSRFKCLWVIFIFRASLSKVWFINLPNAKATGHCG